MDITGNKYEVDFGMAKAILHITSETSLDFIITEGPKDNVTETVPIKLTQLRPQLYLLTWQEKSGTTATQIQDHENGIVYMNWTHTDGEFKNIKGKIRKV